MRPYLEKTLHKNGGVAQSVGPEFKPQYTKRRRRKRRRKRRRRKMRGGGGGGREEEEEEEERRLYNQRTVIRLAKLNTYTLGAKH
jgi:hypothetical protein